MSSLFSDMRRKADEVALEADKRLRITRKQNEIGDVRRQIRQRTTELGDAAYGLHAQGQALSGPLAEICQGIDGLFAAIKAKEAEIDTIRRETLPPVSTVTSACHVCHRPMLPSAAFCPHCGSPRAQPEPTVACSRCGQHMPAEAGFCASCGQAAPAPAPANRCSNCASELPAAAVFCAECGTPVQQASEPTLSEVEPAPDAVEAAPCRQCGHELHADAIFCPECGMSVEPEPEVEEAALAVGLEPEVEEAAPAAGLEPEVEEAAPAVELEQAAAVIADLDEESSESIDVRACPICAADMPLDAVFCAVCGTSIDSSGSDSGD